MRIRELRPVGYIAAGTILLLLAALWLIPAPVGAAPAPALPLDLPAQETPDKPSNAYCLLCHAQPDRVWTLPSGETLSLTIDPEIVANSVHGTDSAKGALQCADCHPSYRYPHPVQTVQTARAFTLSRYAVCRTCHEDQYRHNQDSVHGAALRSGRTEAAVCVDCHGAHDIQPPAAPRERISLTCGKCHGAIFEQYRASVHGTALLAEGNPDVPTCIDCHGVHGIQDPTTALFRVRSPDLCAECHADAALMARYNISTQVFESYLTDFHGSTVALFEQQDPTIATNKAVCYDCHGVHNIKAVSKDQDGVQPIRENLLAVCQHCHPSAEANFPDAWIGHYPATAAAHPTLAAARGLYGFLLPGAFIVSILLVGSSLFGRIRRMFRRGRDEEA